MVRLETYSEMGNSSCPKYFDLVIPNSLSDFDSFDPTEARWITIEVVYIHEAKTLCLYGVYLLCMYKD
jgi:hypothetical protein